MTTAAAFLSPENIVVSPPREIRSTDASKLSFPIQIVIAIVVSAVSASGTIWFTTAGLKSDIRDIRTRMESQVEIRKLEKELLEAQLAAMRIAIESQANRGAALSMAQELSKLNSQRTR